MRARILLVIEVEARHALDDAAGNRRDVIAQWIVADDRAPPHPAETIVQGHPGPRDRGCARPTVSLDDIAIDCDLTFAKRGQVHHRPQRTADQALDFLCAAGGPAARRFTARPGVRCARQHRIFRRDPAAALAPQPHRRLVFQRGGAENMRLAEFHQARALGIARNFAFERNGTQFIGGAILGSHGFQSGCERTLPAGICCFWEAPLPSISDGGRFWRKPVSGPPRNWAIALVLGISRSIDDCTKADRSLPRERQQASHSGSLAWSPGLDRRLPPLTGRADYGRSARARLVPGERALAARPFLRSR